MAPATGIRSTDPGGVVDARGWGRRLPLAGPPVYRNPGRAPGQAGPGYVPWDTGDAGALLDVLVQQMVTRRMGRQ